MKIWSDLCGDVQLTIHLGDELNLCLLLDQVKHDAFGRLAPHLSVLDTDKPRSVSRNITMPPPVLVTMGNWLRPNSKKQLARES